MRTFLFLLVSFFVISKFTAMAEADETSSTASIASSSASSRPAVHNVYTERPRDEDPKDFHIRALASVLGSEEAASGFSATLPPDQASRVYRKVSFSSRVIE